MEVAMNSAWRTLDYLRIAQAIAERSEELEVSTRDQGGFRRDKNQDVCLGVMGEDVQKPLGTTG